MSSFPPLHWPGSPVLRDLRGAGEKLRAFPHGRLELRAGRLHALYLRRLPKLCGPFEAASLLWESLGLGRGGRGDHCLLYYNQPSGMPNYLALKFIVTGLGARFDTFRGALVLLDEIARLRGVDALVTDVVNSRISERLLRRWGWERHLPDSRRRHYIKRFYGNYPPPEAAEPFLPPRGVDGSAA